MIPMILFRAFYDICLFQKRPQDLPAARELLWVILVLYAAVSAVLSYPSQTVTIALVTGLIEAMMLMLITWLFLYLRSVPERWLQTCTALGGTGVIFSLVASPLFYIQVFIEAGQALGALIGTLVVVLLLWNIAVMAHIFKHALSSSYVFGVLGTLTYIALITFTLQLVLADPAGGGL